MLNTGKIYSELFRSSFLSFGLVIFGPEAFFHRIISKFKDCSFYALSKYVLVILSDELSILWIIYRYVLPIDAFEYMDVPIKEVHRMFLLQ